MLFLFQLFLIFVRSAYRIAELSDGWDPKLATNPKLRYDLEGLMVSLACFILTVFSPGYVYGRHSHLYINKSLKNTFSRKKKYYSDSYQGENIDCTIDTLMSEIKEMLLRLI